MDILIIHKKSTCSHPDRMLQVDFLFLPELEVKKAAAPCIGQSL